MGIVPKKAFGQNFLVNPQVIQKILSEVRRHEFEELIEIGPGAGALTEPMLALGLRPHLIELDEDLIEYWQRREMTVTAHDALTLDWTRLHLPAPSLLVSNLPY
ncbi:MAG TPA: rRNA adenine N-6-methyltransferase family protein, partial [Bdellovibrionales bacterium]|nr:rRNA adenine N-6-methyltransferase family protein [Bdellovibrionales bacterium]